VWKAAHGDEFAALLEDSLSERPFWFHRGLDIAMTGLVLRIGEIGRRAVHPSRARNGQASTTAVSTPALVGFALRRLTTAIIVGLGASVIAFALEFTATWR
jgi:hypothetical protein